MNHNRMYYKEVPDFKLKTSKSQTSPSRHVRSLRSSEVGYGRKLSRVAMTEVLVPPRMAVTNCRQIPAAVQLPPNIVNSLRSTVAKTLMEQVKMIQELESEEKNMVFKMVDTFLTKKKFKDFFQKNVAAL